MDDPTKLQNPDLNAAEKVFDPAAAAPVVKDTSFETRQFLRDYLTDQTYQQQIDNRQRTIDAFVAIRPDLTRQQVIDSLPTLYESLTGQKHVDGVGPVERIFQVVDQTLKSAESDAAFWADQRAADMTNSLGAAADFLHMTGPGRRIVEQAKINRVQNEADTAERIRNLNAAIAKTQVDHGGPWWLPIVDNAANLGTSVVQMGGEAAAGTLAAGPVGGALGAWDASSKLMAASSYRTMRERGVDHQTADTVATWSGYVAGALDVVEVGSLAHIALKPIVKKATMAAMPVIARALLETGAKVGAGVATGTTEEVAQEAVLIAGENTGYQLQNAKYNKVLEVLQKARGPLEAQIQAGIDDYNSRALIPLDNADTIAKRLVDTAVQSAEGLAALGLFGGAFGTVKAIKTIKQWDEKKVLKEKVAEVTQDVTTEKKIQAATPQTLSDPIKTSVVDGQGQAITVYHPADQGLASGSADLGNYGNGVRFFTSRNEAETQARGMSSGPLDPNGFIQALTETYPPVVIDAATVVMERGREAAAPFREGLKAWADNNPTMDPDQILDLADSIHTGKPLENRNDIVRAYGLEAALPSGGIIEAKLKADKVAFVDSQEELAKAFKEGAQAVELGGVWHVKDAQNVVVTAKSDSLAEAKVKNSTGDLSFQSKDGTVRALNAKGTEVGRAHVEVTGNSVRLRDLATGEKFRRQGVAKALVGRLIDQHPGKTIDWGEVTTPEGKAFQQSVRQSLPTWDAWGSRIQEAETRKDPALAEFLRQKADTIPDPSALDHEDKPLTRDQLQLILSKGLPTEEVDATLAILDRMAQSVGMDLDGFLSKSLDSVRWVDAIRDENGELRQRANGAVRIVADSGKRMIELAQGRANVSTLLHEMAHVLRPMLSEEDQALLLEWTGETGWTRIAEERFARGFEQFLSEAKPTGNSRIDAILDKLAGWLKLIYDAIFDGDLELSVEGRRVALDDTVKPVFEKILAGRSTNEVPQFGASTKTIFQEGKTGGQDGPLFQEDLAPTPYETTRFEKQLGFLRGGTFTAPLDLGRTPAILRSFGSPDLPLVVPPTKLTEVMGPDGVGGGHGLTLDQIKQVQKELFDPAFVIVSRKDPSRILVVTNVKDDQGRPIVAVIQRAGQIQQHKANVITSIYGRESAKRFFQEEIDRGGVIYRGNEKDGVSYVYRLSWPQNGLLPSGESMMTRDRAVNGETSVLYQDEDVAKVEKAIQAKQATLDLFRENRKAFIEARSAGKTSGEKDTLTNVVDEFLANSQAQIEADRATLSEFVANEGKVNARRDAIREAVKNGKPVPDAWVETYQNEPWAKNELDRRADLRDQLEYARNFDNLDDYLASIVEDRVLEATGDPFDFTGTAGDWEALERKAQEEAVLMPDEHARLTQVYAIAHAKTPEQLDKAFVESLTPETVKRILAGMAQGSYIADKNLPQHVTAQVEKSYEGGTVNEAQIPRILATMKNDPRTYRRIAQQGFADLAELEALAVEQEVEKATREQQAEVAPPQIKPIEIPSDLNFEDKVAIRMGTKSRMEWMRKALDATKELGNLDRTLGILERLSDRWTVAAQDKEQPDYSAEDLAALAALAKENTGKLQNALRSLVTDSGREGAKNADRAAKVFLELVKLVRTEMKTKEAARRAYSDTAEEMRKMGAYLAKPAPKTVHVSIARIIELDRSLIDPHFRTMKKAELLALEAEWFAANPDVIVPRTRRGELFGKNLNLWSYEELHAAYLKRKALEEVGRAKMVAKTLNRDSRRFDLAQKVIEAVYNQGAELQAKIREAEAQGDTKARQLLAEKYMAWEMKRAKNLRNLNDEKSAQQRWGGSAWLLTISNLADKLDGMADYKGINHQLLWSDPNAAENAYLKETDRRKVKMFQWIKDNKIELGKLKDRVKIDGVEGSFSLDALMSVYVGQKNPKKNAALRYGNRFDQRVFDFINRSDELEWVRRLGDRVIEEYEENKQRLFDTVAEYQNIDMGMEENYTPMMRTEVNQDALDQQLNWEAGMAMAVRTASIEKGFTENRIIIDEDHQKPIKLGEFAQWLEMIAKQEQYIAFTPIVADLKSVYLNSEVKSAIRDTQGDGAWTEVDKYIKSLANRYYDKTFTVLDRVMAKLSANASLAYMAYNVGTVLKQLSSLPLFVAHARADLLAASMLKMANPVALIKKVDGLSIQMKTRVGYQELADFRLGMAPASGARTALGQAVRAGVNAAEHAMHRIADPGMLPMQLVDKLVAAAGWDACFETAKAKGMTEAASVEYADWVVGKTQQSTHAKDTAGVMRDNNSMVKAMTLFAGPAVKVFNELIYGSRALAHNGHWLKSLGTLLGIGASSLVFYGIGKGAPPEDEEWWQWVMLGMLNQVPIIGGAATSALQGYDPGNLILNQAIGTVAKTHLSLATALDSAESDAKRENAWKRLPKEGLDIIGLGLGAPVSPVKRIWNAVETGNPGELVGWHSKQTN